MSYEFFEGLLQACQEWASSGGFQSFDELCLSLPAIEDVEFNAEMIGVLFAASMDLMQETKVTSFRTELSRYLESGTTNQALLARADPEPWYHKDILQLLSELLLFDDTEYLQQDIAAVVVQLIITFGLDGIALLGFTLCLRIQYHVGRAMEFPVESAALLNLCLRALAHANDYLCSESVGHVNLAELIMSLA
eukprot:m.24596 g.24596  ORF g.24596 m.24596 type:complete len:193 (-) comp11534_c0_seq1:1492-2070(-)